MIEYLVFSLLYSGTHLLAPTGPCSPGYYCVSASPTDTPWAVNESSCPGEFISNAAICPVGHYCLERSYQPEPCWAGSYQPSVGSDSCLDCPSGYYCPEGTYDYLPYECPVGHFCLLSTPSNFSHPCSPGTYNPQIRATNSSFCIDCDPGTYCQGYGNSAPTGEYLIVSLTSTIEIESVFR